MHTDSRIARKPGGAAAESRWLLLAKRDVAALLVALAPGCTSVATNAAGPAVGTSAPQSAVLPVEPIVQGDARLAGLTLPRASSTQPWDRSVPLLAVTPDAVLLDGTRVIALRNGIIDPADKRDGAAGFFVTPVYEALLRERGSQGSGAEPQASSTRAITVAIDREVPFRTLAELLYTAGQAEIDRFGLLVEGASGPRSVIPIQMPTAPPASSGAAATSLNLVVAITREGVRIAGSGGVLSAGCGETSDYSRPSLPLVATEAMCTDERGYPSEVDRSRRGERQLGPPACAYDLDGLRACMAQIHRTFPDERAVIVSADDSTDYDALVRIVDILRGPDTTPLFPDVLFSAGVM